MKTSYMPVEMPYGVFFKPTNTFLDIMQKEYSDVGILEAGCGTGFALNEMRLFGQANDIGAMAHARGFDYNPRTKMDVPIGVAFHADALDCNYYHKGLQVIVCRPDHGGWVECLQQMFAEGIYKVKRFIYVGLLDNLFADFPIEVINNVSKIHEDVGFSGEVMYVWEFNHED